MKKTKQRYQTGGPIKPNYQTLGNIKFDSNKARQASDGSHLVVTDLNTGKDFGVNRNIDGTYRWKGEAESKHKVNILDSLNPKNWGVTDYSPEKNFTAAFNYAKADKQKEFFWRDNRYATKDIAKPIANAVEVAKSQVIENLKRKQADLNDVPLTPMDTIEALIMGNIPLDEKIKTNFGTNKDSNWSVIAPTIQSNLETIKKQKLQKAKDRYSSKIERVQTINPIVTSAKGNLPEDGYFLRDKNKMFIAARDSLSAVNTARHEFEHSAQDYEDVSYLADDYKKIVDAANKGNFAHKYDQQGFDYISHPDEIGARLFNLQTLMKEKNLKTVEEAVSWSIKNRKAKDSSIDAQVRGYDSSDPTYDVHQLIDLYSGDIKLLDKHLKQYSKPTTKRYATGGTPLLDQLGSVAGMINPIIGAAGAVIPMLSSIFKGPDRTVVSASPGNYQNGGPLDPINLLQPTVQDNTYIQPRTLVANDTLQNDIWKELAFRSKIDTLTQEQLGPRQPMGGFASSGKALSKPRFRERATGGEIDATQVKTFNKEKLKAVQLDLKNRGLYSGKVDGVYGPLTERAIDGYNMKRIASNGVLPEFTVIAPKKGSEHTEALSNLKQMERASGKQLLPLWESVGKPGITVQDPYSLASANQRASFLFETNTTRLNPDNYVTIADVVDNPKYAPFFTGLPKGAIYTEHSKMGKQSADEFISEASHAKQLKDNGYLKSVARLWGDRLQDPYVTYEGQQKQYKLKKSMEHEAHYVIEPKLIEQVDEQSREPKRYTIDAPAQAYPKTYFIPDAEKEVMKETSMSLLFPGQRKSGPAEKAFNKKIKEESNTNYRSGGDIPLSSDSFQVKGNPNVTDGNTYGDVKLDHNEVITKTQQGSEFVFSDDLKSPQGMSYAELAKAHSSAKGKAEKILQSHPYDEQAKSTISQSNALLEQLANQQEAQATAMGLRNEDGSTKQHFATGGPKDPVYMSIPGQPGYYYDPYNSKVLRRDNSTGKYEDVGLTGDRYRPSQNDINAFLQQHAPTQNIPVTIPATGQGPINPSFIQDYTLGTTGVQTPQVAPTTPASNKVAGSKVAKKSSAVPTWLTAGRQFMKNSPATPANERPEMTGFTGLSEPGFPTPNEAVKITSPYFNLYNSDANTLNDPAQDMSSYKTSTTSEDSSYKTPWTFGDSLKAIELGAKGIGAFDRPEKEKPLLDNTQITQQQYDPTNSLYRNQRDFQNLANSATGTTSINMRRGLLNSALANKYSADNGVVSQYQQMNQNAKTDYQQRSSAQRQFNIQSQFRTNDMNAANRAAQDALQQNFFTSIGQFGEDLNRKKYANDTINLLQTQYPDIFNSYINTIQ